MLSSLLPSSGKELAGGGGPSYVHAASLVLCTSAEACTWPVGDVPNQLRVCVNWQTTVASVSLCAPGGVAQAW